MKYGILGIIIIFIILDLVPKKLSILQQRVFWVSTFFFMYTVFFFFFCHCLECTFNGKKKGYPIILRVPFSDKNSFTAKSAIVILYVTSKKILTLF